MNYFQLLNPKIYVHVSQWAYYPYKITTARGNGAHRAALWDYAIGCGRGERKYFTRYSNYPL